MAALVWAAVLVGWVSLALISSGVSVWGAPATAVLVVVVVSFWRLVAATSVVGSVPLLMVFWLFVGDFVGGFEFLEPVFNDGDAFGIFGCHGSDDVLDGLGFVVVVIHHDGVVFGGGGVFVFVFNWCFNWIIIKDYHLRYT